MNLRLDYIIDILELTQEPIRSSRLHERTKLTFKQSRIKYINFLISKEMIEKQYLSPSNRKRKRSREFYNVMYVITSKGRKFMELISDG